MERENRTLSFNGDLYPTAGADVVMDTKGDIVRFDSVREKYGIGSANQILQVKSGLPSWETVDLADTVLTTAGDVLYENATPELARLPAGTQYYNFQMGASLPAWASSSTSTLTTAGDILVASGANALSRLARGSDDQVLKMNGTSLNWETLSAGGATVTKQSVVMGATFDTSSSSFVDVTGVTVTLATRTSLMAFVTCDYVCNITSVNNRAHFQLLVDGVATGISSFWFEDNSDTYSDGNFSGSISAVADSGEIVKLQAHTSGAPNVYFFGSTAGYGTQISALEVS